MRTPVSRRASSAAYCLIATALSIGLSACGGSENAGRPLFPVAAGNNPAPPPTPPPSPPPAPSPTAASPLPEGPSSSFAQQCAPNNSLAAPSLRNATLRKEQQWLRAVMDEAYLWPADVTNPPEPVSRWHAATGHGGLLRRPAEPRRDQHWPTP